MAEFVMITSGQTSSVSVSKTNNFLYRIEGWRVQGEARDGTALFCGVVTR